MVSLLLTLATAAVFCRVLGHEFVFDDKPYVLLNEHVRTGLSAQNLAWALISFHSANWHPLTWVSHTLDCTLFGLRPAGHHLVNLLFHLANTLLLLGLLRRMTGSLWKSAFVAALFALHPLHVESVAWIAERKDVLSTLFWLLTMWAYIRYARSPGIGTYIPVVIFFALGLMSKPMLVTLPFVLLLLDYWPLGRSPHPNPLPLRGCTGEGASGLTRYSLLVTPSRRGEALASRGGTGDRDASQSFARSSTSTRLMIEKVPLLLLAAASSVVTYIAQQKGEAVGSSEQYSLGIRAANAALSYVGYIGKMLWPRGLAVFYPHPGASIPAWQVVGAAVLLLAITVIAVRVRRIRPYFTMGWLWYVGTLVPVIGLIQVGGQAMADRYTYIPLIGLFVAIAWGVPELVGCLQKKGGKGEWENGGAEHRTSNIERRTPNTEHPTPNTIPHEPSAISHSPILPFSAAVSLAALAVVAWFQVGCWQDSISLFGRAVGVTRGNWLMHNNLGVALAAEGRQYDAIGHYSAAIRAKPEYADAHNNLGNALSRLGRFDEAIGEYREAISLDPGNARAHYNLGAVLAGRGRLDEAIAAFSEAVRIDPNLQAARDALEITQRRQAQSDAR